MSKLNPDIDKMSEFCDLCLSLRIFQFESKVESGEEDGRKTSFVNQNGCIIHCSSHSYHVNKRIQS